MMADQQPRVSQTRRVARIDPGGQHADSQLTAA